MTQIDARERFKFEMGAARAAKWADVVVEMTPEQTELLRPLFDALPREGTSGLMIAQIWDGHHRDTGALQSFAFVRLLLGDKAVAFADATRKIGKS